MDNLKIALFLLVGLVPGLVLHELAHALAADRLGDPTPRRWGRLSLRPRSLRSLVDPFGTVILPALILLLWASGSFFRPPPFAYSKPMPTDPGYLRQRDRDVTLIALAGPVANLAVAFVAGLILRAGLSGDALEFVYRLLYVNVIMGVFQLMPVPGLDGARILARFLPPRARAVYTGLDQYLVLFMLLIFFLLGGPLLAIVDGLAGGACRLIAGVSC